MARIFISYSSKNKEFARTLALDLAELGHDPWLDEWEIRVGECIPSKIEHGISEADYVVVVLSPSSVNSGWVEKEWQTKYWDEIEQNKTLVLPALIEDCKIPPLLKIKKHADFRKSYAIGLVQLTGALNPVIGKTQKIEGVKPTDYGVDISALLSKIQSRTIPLSQCIAEALTIAKKIGNNSLERFCRSELTGWDQKKLEEYPDEKPTYRLIEIFVSLVQINMQYWGWGRNASNVFDYMRKDSGTFIPLKRLVPEPVSKLETLGSGHPQKGILLITMQQKDFIPESKAPHPDTPVYGYAKADSYMNVLESIRVELTKRLLDLLPKIESQ